MLSARPRDGFEWAVHETNRGGEPTMVEALAQAMRKASPKSFKGLEEPRAPSFG